MKPGKKAIRVFMKRLSLSVFVFSGSVSTNYGRDCSHSANRSYKHQTVLLTFWDANHANCTFVVIYSVLCWSSCPFLSSLPFSSSVKKTIPGFHCRQAHAAPGRPKQNAKLTTLLTPSRTLRGLHGGEKTFHRSGN